MGHLQFIAQQPFYSHIFFIYINSVLNQHCFASVVQVRESPFAGDCSNSAGLMRKITDINSYLQNFKVHYPS
jgi:hypothetical protein